MIDTEGYELRRLPLWYSPLTDKKVYFDAYSMLAFWREMTQTDVIAFLRERGFIGEEYLLLEGEFDRGELEEREGMFKVDPQVPTIIRKYIRRRYYPELLTAFTIIEELEYLRVFLTFSIETGAGHEPFYAEVTCDSVILPELSEDEQRAIIRRIVNGVLKLFFIIFDGNKVVSTAKERKDPDWMIRTLMYLQRYADPVYEGRPLDVDEQRGGMDGFLDIVDERIKLRPVDEFLTRESVITIGIEYESATDMIYGYPYVHVVIEKVRVRKWHQKRTLILAPTTNVWMDRTLNMVITW